MIPYREEGRKEKTSAFSGFEGAHKVGKQSETFEPRLVGDMFDLGLLHIQKLYIALVCLYG